MAVMPDERDFGTLKYSVDILDDIARRIAQLAWEYSHEQRRVRARVEASECHAIIGRLESFQESPQLLDPIMAVAVGHLTSAFCEYLLAARNIEPAFPHAEMEPTAVNIIVALGKILYTWMKVRGFKVVLRLFPNDPKWLDPMVKLFEEPQRLIDRNDQSNNVLNDVIEEGAGSRSGEYDLPWHLRYVSLVWISHLLYTPFDLVTIADDSAERVVSTICPELPLGIPQLAKRILNAACRYIGSSGKDREGAAVLMVRLVIRNDTQTYLLDWFVAWVSDVVRSSTDHTKEGGASHVYLLAGLISALAGVFSSGERLVVGGSLLLDRAYETILQMLCKDDSRLLSQSAILRKIFCKLLRNVSYLYMAPPGPDPVSEDAPPFQVEEIIDQLLKLLSDRDSSVRYAASKSLSSVALRLSREDRSQIFETIIDLYDSDVLYPRHTATNIEPHTRQKKNLSQVSANLWHGLTLTIASFLRSHAATPPMLPKVLDCITSALSFEQRKATFAVGGNVRDAACYAAWSLARNYSTEELLTGKPLPPHPNTITLPQLLAQELVVTACLDPSGNIRRGASAALQELVGRHPNMIKDGISLVQVVDYSAVALQSRASVEVAARAATLGNACYWECLVSGLVEDWRGIGLQDPTGRTISGKGIGILAKIGIIDLRRRDTVWILVDKIIQRYGVGGSLDREVRHGSWYALADIIFVLVNELRDKSVTLLAEIFVEMKTKTQIFDAFHAAKPRDFVSPVLKPEMTCEAAAYLINALSDAAKIMCSQGYPDLSITHLRRYLCVIDAALERWEETVTTIAVCSAESFFLHMNERFRVEIVKLWLGKSRARARRILVVKALGAVFRFFKDSTLMEQEILNGIIAVTWSPHIEMRVAAQAAFADGVFPQKVQNELILQALLRSLSDYTVDSRGDVGSWARVEAIRAVLSLHSVSPLDIDIPNTTQFKIFQKIVSLAVEKLDKVRLKACDALVKITARDRHWANGLFDGLSPQSTFWSSSEEYFRRMIRLLEHREMMETFLEGYATSAGAGSDSVMRSSTRAMHMHLNELPAYSEQGDRVSLGDIAQTCISIIERHMASGDDRIVIPALGMLGSWFESGIMEKLHDSPFDFQHVFTITHKAQTGTSNIAKLNAAIKIYNGLSAIQPVRELAMRKLLSMLMHPFPKIRGDVAETLYLILSIEGNQEDLEALLTETNWLGDPTVLKPIAEEIKAGLVVQ